jgi:anti-sigma regulatory factor (Ser/Thr protein kinase)/nucleoid DNA-binding protein
MDVTTKQLAKEMAAVGNTTEEKALQFVHALASAITFAISTSKDFQIKGFGRFLPTSGDSKGSVSTFGDVASRVLGLPADVVTDILSKLSDILQRELFVGKRILLDGVGTFEGKFIKPFVERAYGGHKMVRPPTFSINFVSATPGKVTFVPDDSLKNRANQYREASVLLLMPQVDFFVETLVYYFQRAGWKAEPITTVAEARERIRSKRAYLLVIDSSLPDHQQLVEELKASIETSSIPMILIFAQESTLYNPQDVIIVGDNNIFEPFEVRKLLDMIDDEVVRVSEEELIFRQQMQMYLPTEEKFIDKAIDKVNKMMSSTGLHEERQNEMYVAFREAVLNAAQHGNKYQPEKRIEIQYLLDHEKLTLVVKDQGEGFDYNLYVKTGSADDPVTAARRRHMQGRMGGLGIMLMLRSVDKLEYFGIGNQVSLTKYIRKGAQVAKPQSLESPMGVKPPAPAAQ